MFLKIILAIVIYIGIIEFGSKIEQIKGIDDTAFDILVSDVFLGYEESRDYLYNHENNISLYMPNLEELWQKKIPKIDLFLIEDQYLKEYGLQNYGYFFPRKSMNEIVEALIYSLEDMQKSPQAIFIDFDFHYTEQPFGRTLSLEDKKLIDNLLLLSQRTVVLIPKTNKFHYIENYIKKNSFNTKNLLFVSPNFTITSDLITRRFQAYSIIDKKVYLNVDLVVYLLATHQCNVDQIQNIKQNEKNNSIIVCQREIKKFDIVNDRFLPKLTHKYINNSYKYGYTLWDRQSKKQNIRSVSTLLEDSIVPESLENSIIIIGAKYSGNHDYFTIANTILPESPIKLAGVLLHLNTINSLFFLDGALERLPLLSTIVLIVITLLIINFIEYFVVKKGQVKKFLFVLLFIVISVFVSYIFSRYGLFYALGIFLIFIGILKIGYRFIKVDFIKEVLENIVMSGLLTVVVFFTISAILLFYYHYWFNWLSISIVYEVANFLNGICTKYCSK